MSSFNPVITSPQTHKYLNLCRTISKMNFSELINQLLITKQIKIMKKITLLFTMLGLMIGTLNLNAQVFEFSLANQSEADAFVGSLPTGYGSTGTIQSNQFGSKWGVKLLANSSLTYTATGLAAGNYTMEAHMVVQNSAVLPYIQDVWPDGGTPATPVIVSNPANNNTFVTYTKVVNIPSAGDYTFGIVRGGSGSQLIVSDWKVTQGTLSVDDAVIKNNFTISKTGVSLKDISGNIQIIDLLGRVLASKELKNQEKLDFEFNSSTIYIVKVATISGTASKKVIF